MLDIKLIREQTDRVRSGVLEKGEDGGKVDEALALDARRRELLQKTESLKSRKNTVSAEIARRKAGGTESDALIAEMRTVAESIHAIDAELSTVEAELRSVLLLIPNIPDQSVPPGKTAAQNRVLSTWGEEPSVDYALKPHWELMEKLRIVDFLRGTKHAVAYSCWIAPDHNEARIRKIACQTGDRIEVVWRLLACDERPFLVSILTIGLAGHSAQVSLGKTTFIQPMTMQSPVPEFPAS